MPAQTWMSWVCKSTTYTAEEDEAQDEGGSAMGDGGRGAGGAGVDGAGMQMVGVSGDGRGKHAAAARHHPVATAALTRSLDWSSMTQSPVSYFFTISLPRFQ